MGITTLITSLIRLSKLTGEAETSVRFVERLALEDSPDQSRSTLSDIREWSYGHLDAVAHHGLAAGLPVVAAAHAVIEAVDAILEIIPSAEAVLIDLTETVETAAGGFETDWAEAFAKAAATGRNAISTTQERFVDELDRLVLAAISDGDEVWFDLLCEVGSEVCELLEDLAEVC